MILVHDLGGNILHCSPTLPKAMEKTGIPAIKYEYLRGKISMEGKYKYVNYKGYLWMRIECKR